MSLSVKISRRSSLIKVLEYNSNRKQQVKLDGTKSSFIDITCGVPQGCSILGPLLFLIYINDMKNSFKNSVLHHFADDTNLLCSDARKNFEHRFTLTLNRTTLFESTKIKYLGLILDKALSRKHHIFELRKKL